VKRPTLSVPQVRRSYRAAAASKVSKIMVSKQPRACIRCRFMDIQKATPPQIFDMLICRWGPRHLTQLPTPQGIINASNFPVVAEDDWCYQFSPIVDVANDAQ